MAHRFPISCPQKLVTIDRAQIRAAAQAVLHGEGVRSAEISLAFVDNPTIHRINRQFLDHDEPTDVISFPLGDNPLSGELVIGVEVARAEATARGHDVQAELTLYVIHGLLHLCGYDDHRAADRQAMRRRERHYLGLLGLRLK